MTQPTREEALSMAEGLRIMASAEQIEALVALAYKRGVEDAKAEATAVIDQRNAEISMMHKEHGCTCLVGNPDYCEVHSA